MLESNMVTGIANGTSKSSVGGAGLVSFRCIPVNFIRGGTLFEP